MKKMIIGLFSVLMISAAGRSQVKNFSQLVGRWQIAGPENAGAELEIIDSNTIVLRYQGETKNITDAKFDFSRSPAWFDFKASDTASSVPVKSIVEVVGKDVMKWQLFLEGERIPYFTSKHGELLYLRRNKSMPEETAGKQ